MEKEYQSLTDRDLIAVVLSNKEAFSAIIYRYEAALRRYIFRLGVRNSGDIEDILQNVFIKCYRYLRSFNNSFPFSSWIYRIAHNETYDFFRSKKRRPEIALDESLGQNFLNIETNDNNEYLFDKEVDSRHVNEALESLDKKYRDVLLLRYVEEKDYAQISDILQIPPGSVATLIHRGKIALRKALEKKQ